MNVLGSRRPVYRAVIRMRTLWLVAFSGAALLAAAPAPARLSTPVPISPSARAVVDALPAFAWRGVKGASQYEFELAADRGFNAPVFGGDGHFFTKNTRATLRKTPPNGNYWWHVRASTKSGATSPWSEPRLLRKAWTATAVLRSPRGGAVISYPSTITLSWTAVPRAAGYLVSIAPDPLLASVVGGKPIGTAATALTWPGALPPGVYYWGITPVDAQGNRGVPSLVASFTWLWPSKTTPRVDDLAPAVEVFDPRFSWDAVPGAARYEVEVNPSQDFAPGSKVCCSSTTIATALSPTTLLRDNTFYWRVRAIDVDGNAGVWNIAPPFTKTFDKVPPVSGTSIKNLRMAGSDALPDEPGFQTSVPLVTWDPVPGAASYYIEVALLTGFGCDWGDAAWRANTSVPAWTPLGWGRGQYRPYPASNVAIADDGNTALSAAPYCVRVRARSDRDARNNDIFGDFTELNDGSGSGFAFGWPGPPLGDVCSAPCNRDNHYLGVGDYLAPIGGVVSSRTPYFTWRPLHRLARKTFRNIDGADALTLTALSDEPVYNTISVTVEDDRVDSAFDYLVIYVSGIERERYRYPDRLVGGLAQLINDPVWPDLPSEFVTATVAVGDVALARVTRSVLVPGKVGYFVIVAKDSDFSNIVDYAFTRLPAYAPRSRTRATTYPDETTLYYWAVLPAALLPDGWFAPGSPKEAAPSTFHKQSVPPALLAPASGADVLTQPSFQWTAGEGARRYRLQVAHDPSFGDPIDDVVTNSTSYTSDTTYPADTALYWRVRADDENLIGLTWSGAGSFRKRHPVPQPRAETPKEGDFLPTWAWDAITGAVTYDVLVELPDGTHRDLSGTRAAALTPVLMWGTGLFHWRVRANFPKATFGVVHGSYSSRVPFARTIAEPTGARAERSSSHVLLTWEPKPGVKSYRVQISTRRDFGRSLEQITTDNTSYAPRMTQASYHDGTTIYWRVAGIDEGRNVGDFTPGQAITSGKRLLLTVRGRATHGRNGSVTVLARNASRRAVPGTTVRVSGAGIRPRALRTNRKGLVTFRVKPTRRGALVFRATKTGFRVATASLRVR